mmetsp:Transcript_4137/g.8118  ORF Transcript_4137/g.8118 Transcript_4137/m.8118 type:complete len:212 (-) Transcript_4137:468-1103(-)
MMTRWADESKASSSRLRCVTSSTYLSVLTSTPFNHLHTRASGHSGCSRCLLIHSCVHHSHSIDCSCAQRIFYCLLILFFCCLHTIRSGEGGLPFSLCSFRHLLSYYSLFQLQPLLYCVGYGIHSSYVLSCVHTLEVAVRCLSTLQYFITPLVQLPLYHLFCHLLYPFWAFIGACCVLQHVVIVCVAYTYRWKRSSGCFRCTTTTAFHLIFD